MGVCRFLKIWRACCEATTTDRPGGTPKPFCEPEMTISRFHSSKRISSDPREQTPSTTTKVSGEIDLTVCAIDWMSDKTPVLQRKRLSHDTSLSFLFLPDKRDTYDVSTWVIVTILYFLSLKAFLTSSVEGREPTSERNIVILAPYTVKLMKKG